MAANKKMGSEHQESPDPSVELASCGLKGNPNADTVPVAPIPGVTVPPINVVAMPMTVRRVVAIRPMMVHVIVVLIVVALR